MSTDTYKRGDANKDDCNILERIGGFKGKAVETPVTENGKVTKNASNKKG